MAARSQFPITFSPDQSLAHGYRPLQSVASKNMNPGSIFWIDAAAIACGSDKIIE
jgi:hypothetical protein